MRSRRRSERRGRAWSLIRGTSALAVLVTAGALTACAPSGIDSRPTSTPRETSIDIAAPPEYTAARETALAVRDDSLALLTATDEEPEPTVAPESPPPVVLPPSTCDVDPRTCFPEPTPTVGDPLD